MRKLWFFLLLLLILVILFAFISKKFIFNESNSEPENTKANINYTICPTKNIDPTLPKIKQGEVIIKHKYYTLGYNEKYEEADWVAYKLTSEMISGNTKRKNNFRVDPMVSTGSSNPNDYKNSGYDKGHLCPAADMSLSEEAMSETFFMSNMSPQTPQFNRGIWKKLEEKVREWAKKNDEIYVTTGPIIRNSYKTIGTDNVAVPQYYYKVILDYKEPGIKGIGFIMKNEGSKENLEKYAVTIDSVETFTGFDFFTVLPDSIECVIEGKFDFFAW